MSAFVQVRGLSIDAVRHDGASVPIVRDVSFDIPRGEVLSLIGESGSGKSSVALALMGYARSGCRIVGGDIRVGDVNVLALDAAGLRALRGRRISYVAQSAAAAFNPSRTLLDQVIEPALVHGTAARTVASAKAVELFRALALPDPEHIGARYPHQVSGGQLQRAMAAMALITDPELVIFDEPTTALDVTTQVEVLLVFKRAIRERGVTALYVSHDLAVVAQMADQIVVMKHGTVQEINRTERVLSAPAAPYTRELLAAAAPQRRQSPAASAATDRALLRVQGLQAGYKGRDPVLRDVSFELPTGRTLGVIGESGSGKSTLLRVIAGLMAPASGLLQMQGESLDGDIGKRSLEQQRRIQLIFQNADTALNPAHSVRQILARPLRFYDRCGSSELDVRIRRLLERVHLPASCLTSRPNNLSGGQKQRLALARALAAEPDLLLCDEITASLDTVVGASILDLLTELKRELSVSFLFITHDIQIVRSICDGVLVLQHGEIVERAADIGVFDAPQHAYTQALCASVPPLRTGWLDAQKSATLPQAESANRAG